MDKWACYKLEGLKNVFSAAPCGVGIFVAGKREPLFLNAAYYEMVGYTPEDYAASISNEDRKLLFPMDLPINVGLEQQYAGDGSLTHAEYRIVQKNGGICWVALTMGSISVDGVECALCFFEDITAARENFAQMKLVADSIGSSICVIRIKNGKEHLLYGNETFFNLIGIDRKTYLQNADVINNALTTELDRCKTHDAIQQSIRTGAPQVLTYRFLRPGKAPIWMERRLSAIPQDEADTYLVASVATDITEKKCAEIALALEQHRYQTVIDEMKAAVFEWDFHTGAFYSSDNYREYAMSAIRPELLMANEGPSDIIHPGDKPLLVQFFADTRSGVPRAEAILRMKLTAGGYRWCRLVGLFYKDEQGNPSRTLGIIIDLSAEKEKSVMLDSLLNELPGGVAVFKVGKTLACPYFNDGFARLSDRTRAEMEDVLRDDRFVESVIAPPDLARFTQGAQARLAAGENMNITFRFLSKNGTLRWLHMTASKLREEDGCPVYYCVFTTPSEETELYRNIVEDSSTGVFVAERKTRRIVYCNERMRQLYRLGTEVPVVGRVVLEVIPRGELLMSDAELDGLPTGRFVEYHRQHGEVYLGIRAKAISWNGADCYILYISDETQEHQKRMRQKELLNLVPMGIGIYEICDGALCQIYMNDSYYRMVGALRKVRQQKRDGFMHFVHPDDLFAIQSAVHRCIHGSNEETIDHRICCGDGQYRWFRLAASVVKRSDDKITLYCGYADIDDTITAQEALKKANVAIQKQYAQELSQRKMLEKDSMLAVQFNVTQDKLISYRVNQGLVKEFDKGTLGSLIRPDIADSIPTAEERRVAADFFDVQQAITRFQNGIKEFSAVYRRRLNDGRLYWLQTICRLALDEETGELISYTYLRNIDTERKKELAAESVIDEETDFVMLLNTVSNTAMLLRLRDNYGSPRWKLYTEFPFDRVRDVDEGKIVDPEDRQAFFAFFHKQALLERLAAEPVATLVYRHRYPDGTMRRKKTRVFYLDSTHEDIVIARRDITDIYEEEQARQRALQTALDEAESASRAKSDFLSRMSHDLRTPMNVIIGLTSMAMDRVDKSPEMREMLFDITSSAKYLLSLINDCLDLEKITSGKIELHPAPYAYADFYNNVRAVIGPLCREKNITLILTDKEKGRPAILADRMRMEQIFYNLLSNAVKFTPFGGKIEFLVQDSLIHNGFNSFLCIVRDSGVGMSEEFQRHMFEAFTQEQSNVTPEYQGSGLGLAIVKQLAELMGATISVKSKPGEGTAFTLRFCFPVAEDLSEPAAEAVSPAPERLQGKRILLAEDHPLNRMIAVKLLEKMGMIVVTATNGQEALDQFQSVEEGYFDAILLDIRMPLMNGLEAARAIRSVPRPEAKAIPILAMTANAFAADVQESLRAGMNAHLSKPIEAQKLYEELARLIP